MASSSKCIRRDSSPGSRVMPPSSVPVSTEPAKQDEAGHQAGLHLTPGDNHLMHGFRGVHSNEC